jgi:uncharacterized protein (TIGR04222 family)
MIRLSDLQGSGIPMALIALDVRGAIDCGEQVVHELADTGSFTLTSLRTKKPPGLDPDFVVRPIRPPSAEASPIEQAVHEVVATTAATAGNLATIRIVAVASPAVRRSRERLLAQGLAPAEEHSVLVARRARWVRGIVVALTLGLLVVHFRSGTRGDTSVTALGVFCFAGWASSRPLAALTARGSLCQHHLRAARSRHPAQYVERRDPPLGRVPELDLLVALHGERTLWTFDPALALALRLPHPAETVGGFEWPFDLDGCDGCGCD